MRVWRAVTLLWLLGLKFEASGPLLAQDVKPQTSNRPSLQVFLVTIGEGGAVWEKFGHNSLWFTDSAGIDEAYNWGMFDFNAPGFVWRFVTGDTKYWMQPYRGRDILRFFSEEEDRTIDIQRLNLTDEQARAALAAARTNALDANKYYRYDYFLDNCSTRVRDAIDAAVGGALRAATANDTVPRSFRSESVRLTDDMGFAQFGITTALGRFADRPLTKWEDAFVPMRLRDIVRDVRVTLNGKQEPLVLSERTYYQSKARTERDDVPSFWLVPLIIGLALAVDLVGLGLIGLKSKGVNLVFHVEAAVISALSGLLGAAILFAWLFTKHSFWAMNENLLIVNPLSVWLAPLAVLSATRDRWKRPAAVLASIIAMCTSLALLLKGLPGSQQNLPVIALMVPIHFAVAFGLWQRGLGDVAAPSGKPSAPPA